jgi:hypothetical protein
MSEQLIDRLNAPYITMDALTYRRLLQEAEEAADTIERLRAENEALKKDATQSRTGRLYRDESAANMIRYRVDNPFGPVAISIPACYPDIADWIDEASGVLKAPTGKAVYW